MKAAITVSKHLIYINMTAERNLVFHAGWWGRGVIYTREWRMCRGNTTRRSLGTTTIHLYQLWFTFIYCFSPLGFFLLPDLQKLDEVFFNNGSCQKHTHESGIERVNSWVGFRCCSGVEKENVWVTCAWSRYRMLPEVKFLRRFQLQNNVGGVSREVVAKLCLMKCQPERGVSMP